MPERAVETSFQRSMKDSSRAYVRAQKHNLALLDIGNERDFSFLIKAAIKTGIPRSQLSKRLSVSPATISRWSQGTSAPNRLVRKVVAREVGALLEEIERGYHA